MSQLPPILQTNDVAPSAEQFPAVLCRDSDVVVTAGAGAGKTRTLVGRYISLLHNGYPLRSIVAITFTRKAAREMRIRIREVVRAYQANKNLVDAERQRWQQIYLALDSARIGTIHSLCTELLHSHPVEADIDPAFRVLEEGQSGLLQQQALDAGMAFIANQQDLAVLFSEFGERNLRYTLNDLMKRRLDADLVFSQQPTDLEPIWRTYIREHRHIALSNLVNIPEWKDAVAVIYSERASDALDRVEIQRRNIVQVLDAFNEIRDAKLLQPLEKINLSGGRGQAWPGGAGQRDTVKTALRSLRDLWKAQSSGILMSFNVLDAVLVETLPLFKRVFLATVNHYTMLKAQQNVLDFDDLEIKALNLLKEHLKVCERWQQTVQALLVDEFQDTNTRQRELLDYLNGHDRKLFIVGDGKQSIYRFRGADVSVYREKKAQITKTGKAYALTESYRAHHELIAVLNACLEPILGKHEVAGASWIEPFAALTPIREESVGCRSPYMEFHLTVGSKIDGALQLAAECLVERLRQIIDGSGKAMTFDDIAILCRASTSFRPYEDALDRVGIPYITVSGRGFYDRPEIRDVLNVLKALADPTDDLAMVGLLRSPPFGLSDMTVYRLVNDARINGATSLWAFMCNTASVAIDDTGLIEDLGKVSRVCQYVQVLHELVGRVTVSDILKEFLDMTDYRAALKLAGSSRSDHNIAKLLADAHGSGILSIPEFLNYIKGLRNSGGREGEAAILSAGAVRIMTVHAAKGLEFGLVVIGDIGRREVNKDGLLIDNAFGVLPLISRHESGKKKKILPASYEIARERERTKALAESDRMLYVAATRAKEMLLLSGTARMTKQSSLSLDGWLDRLAGEHNLDLVSADIVVDPEGDAVHFYPLPVSTDTGIQYPVGCYVYEPNYQTQLVVSSNQNIDVKNGKPPYPLMDTLVPQKVIPDEKTRIAERQPPRSVWRVVPENKQPSVPGWVVGTLVHKALARWYFPDDPGFYIWAEALVNGYGVADEISLHYAIRHTTTHLNRFKQSTIYHNILAAERRLSEVPYTFLDNAGRVEYGTVDTLYSLDSQWHLVEYKTDYIKNDHELDTLLSTKDYLLQMAKYLNAIECLLGERPLPHLCFLNYSGSILSITDRWA